MSSPVASQVLPADRLWSSGIFPNLSSGICTRAGRRSLSSRATVVSTLYRRSKPSDCRNDELVFANINPIENQLTPTVSNITTLDEILTDAEEVAVAASGSGSSPGPDWTLITSIDADDGSMFRPAEWFYSSDGNRKV